MGYDVDWDARGECEPLPKNFTDRIVGRQEFMHALWDGECLSLPNCGCGEKHDYFCAEPDSSRPVDFAAFRARLAEKGLLREPFTEWVDYLERNPNMYLSFNC